MKHLLLIVLLFLVAGAAWRFYGEIIEDHVDIGEVLETPLLLGKDSLVVEDQESDGRVEVAHLTLSRRGYIVFQDDEQGPGRVIGVSELFDAGRKADFSVDLSEDADSGYVFASLYQDDGDGAFNIENDIPIRGPALAPVQQRFLLALPPSPQGE